MIQTNIYIYSDHCFLCVGIGWLRYCQFALWAGHGKAQACLTGDPATRMWPYVKHSEDKVQLSIWCQTSKPAKDCCPYPWGWCLPLWNSTASDLCMFFVYFWWELQNTKHDNSAKLQRRDEIKRKASWGSGLCVIPIVANPWAKSSKKFVVMVWYFLSSACWTEASTWRFHGNDCRYYAVTLW